MDQRPFAPMGVGKILDQSFSLYRSHFGVFVLLALLWMGPFLLLQDFALKDVSNMPLLYQESASEDAWEALAEKFIASEELMTDNIALLLIFSFVILPLMTLVAYPQLLGATFLITKGAVEGEKIELKQAVKQSFRRFWPLVGSTAVYMLIALGIIIGLMLVFGLVVFLFVLAFGETDPFAMGSDINPILIVLLVIAAYLVFLAAIILVPGFFLLRWGFYLPHVLEARGGLGIGNSWGLTKGNFWRLFGMYMVVMILYSMFSGGVQMVITAGLGISILGTLIMMIAHCLLMPWGMIVYSLAYLDLRVRREGTDLQMMLAPEASEPAATTSLSEKPGEGHE